VRSDGPDDLYGARIDSAGHVLDPDGRSIATSGSVTAPALAFNGTNFLVAWTDSFGYHVHVSRITPAGAILSPAATTMPGNADRSSGASVASDGTGFLVDWRFDSSDHGIRAARVSAAGALVDQTPIVVTEDETNVADGSPAVAFDGTDYLVAWWRRTVETPELRAARVTTGGTVVDVDGITLVSGSAGDVVGPPVASHHGASTLIAWRRETRIEDLVIAADGSPGDVATIGNGDAAALVANTDGWGVAYSRFVAGPPFGSERTYLRTVAPK
jgi:hypothetical protein